MCPSVLTLASKHQDDTSRYMCEVMRDAKQKRFILAPYIQSEHWILLMFCVHESAVYVFDPLNQKRDLYVKALWDTTYKVYTRYGGRKNNQNNLLWYHEAVQCPQQKGGTECGYFVMRYMYDIVMLSRKDPKVKWTEGLGKRYTNRQIEEIRDIWANYITREYM